MALDHYLCVCFWFHIFYFHPWFIANRFASARYRLVCCAHLYILDNPLPINVQPFLFIFFRLPLPWTVLTQSHAQTFTQTTNQTRRP